MPESSAGTSVNFGPVAQAPQTPALQARTRNWYATPVVLPIVRESRVLFAVGSASVTGCQAPTLFVVFPVAICSSEVPPPVVHVTSTGSLLLASGENSWIGRRGGPGGRPTVRVERVERVVEQAGRLGGGAEAAVRLVRLRLGDRERGGGRRVDVDAVR